MFPNKNPTAHGNGLSSDSASATASNSIPYGFPMVGSLRSSDYRLKAYLVETGSRGFGVSLKQAQALNAEGKPVLLDIHTNLEARRSNFD